MAFSAIKRNVSSLDHKEAIDLGNMIMKIDRIEHIEKEMIKQKKATWTILLKLFAPKANEINGSAPTEKAFGIPPAISYNFPITVQTSSCCWDSFVLDAFMIYFSIKTSGNVQVKFSNKFAKPTFNAENVSGENLDKNILNSGLIINLPLQIKNKRIIPGIVWERIVERETQ